MMNNSLRRGLQACLYFAHYVKNMTSYRKLEAHNILHCCQKRNEPRPHITYTEKFVKFGHVVFETREQTDTPTDIQAR